MDKALFGYLSMAVNLGMSAVYLASIFRGRTRPHAFTWGIWGVISTIVFFAQYTEGAGPGAWNQGVNAAVCAVIAAIALVRGDRDYRPADWAALAAALFSIALWLAMKTPLWSVLLLCLIDILAFIPTVRKSWLRPDEEPLIPYILWGMAAGLSIAAITLYDLVNWAYPALLAALNFGFVVMVWLRRRAKKQTPDTTIRRL